MAKAFIQIIKVSDLLVANEQSLRPKVSKTRFSWYLRILRDKNILQIAA